jgi:hypothetical protein
MTEALGSDFLYLAEGRAADQEEDSEMITITVSDEREVSQLVNYLLRLGCSSMARPGGVIDAALPESASAPTELRELTSYLDPWKRSHPQINLQLAS